MTAYELFEAEGFLDDYAAMSDKILLHVEEFLKFPKSAEVEPNTVIFGVANKLHLAKSKMKSNESFKVNAECVDVRDLLKWIEDQKLLRDTEKSVAHTAKLVEQEDVLNDEQEDYIVQENSNNPELTEDEVAVLFNASNEDETPAEHEDTADAEDEEIPDKTDVVHPNRFVYEYLANQKPISSIASYLSVDDYTNKELVDDFIKKLRSSSYASVANRL